jgi:drug/metabolite transporter (DMT)-like permease
MISVAYRFFLAAFILFIYASVSSLNLKYSLKEHGLMGLLGFFLFGINYWLVYTAELTLTSGLVAVVFSSIIFLNIINGAIFLKLAIRWYVFFGALTGMVGIALVFKDELLNFDISSGNTLAFILAIGSAALASLGNITSAHIQKKNLPVIQTNAFGMLYGACIMLIISFVNGKSFVFDLSFPYIASLLYLSIFGSIIAFGCYLTLLGNIGPDKSAYVTLLIPVIALIMSTFFEDYSWTLTSLIGITFILGGNFIILKRKKPGIAQQP